MKEIQYYQLGSLLGEFYSNTDIFMWENEREQLLQLQPGTSRLTAGDRVYFSNNVEYPRFKFREWGSNENITISRSMEKATAILVNLEDLKSSLDLLKKTSIAKETIHQAININGVLQIHNGVIYTELGSFGHKGFTDKPLVVDLYKLTLYKKDITILEEYSRLNTLIQAGGNYKLIDYNDFLTQVSDGMVLDMNTFWNIDMMMKSDDWETKNIGIEMMTNFNITKSMFLLDLLLLTNFNHIVRHSRLWDKVTLKPLKAHADALSLYGSNFSNTNLRSVGGVTQLMNFLLPRYKERDLMSCVDTSAVKELYMGVLKNEHTNINIKLPGLRLHTIIFDLDINVFPDQLKHYIADEQEEQDNGTSLGDQLPEDITEDISEYSDYQE